MLSYLQRQALLNASKLKCCSIVLWNRCQSNIHRSSESLLIPTRLEMLTKLRSDIFHNIDYDILIIGGA